MKSRPRPQDAGDKQEYAHEQRQRERRQNRIVENDDAGTSVHKAAELPEQEATDAAG